MIDDWDGLLHRVAPKGDSEILDGLADALPPLFEHARIDTPRRVAHALAQWFVESAGYTRLEENLNYSARRLRQVYPKYVRSDAQAAALAGNPRAIANLVYGGRLGNRPGTDDGWTFRGGGITQNTGRENYRAAGYENRPDELRAMPGAAIAAVAFWVKNGLNALADTDSVEAVTRRINGGTNGLAERKAAYRRIRPIVDRYWAGGEAEDEAPTREDVLAAPDPLPPAKPSQAEIKGLQTRLIAFGYREVGKVDGLWGGRTAGALAAFQTDKGLPVTGQLDAATQVALTLPFVRPVAPERANATVTSLAAQGSVIAKQSLQQKAIAWLTGAGATVYGAVSGASEYWSDAQDKVGSLKGLLATVPDWVWLALAGGIAFYLWHAADRVGKARVEDERSGKTA